MPVGLSLRAFLSGSLLGVGLILALTLLRGPAQGLVHSAYAAAGGALAGGLYLARRHPGPRGVTRLTAALVGLGVGLWLPLAAWALAPALGFQVGPFNPWPQAALSAGAGLAGTFLHRAASRARPPGRSNP